MEAVGSDCSKSAVELVDHCLCWVGRVGKGEEGGGEERERNRRNPLASTAR